MPPSASWSKQLQEAGVPGEAAEVVALAYASDQLFYHAFRNEDRLDSSVLVKTKAISQDDTEWDIHPTVAALRAIWRSMKSTTSASVPAPAAEKAARDCTALVPFLQASSRMSSGDNAKLVEKDENDYPGVGVCPMVLPSLQYLQCIKSQCSSQSWEWTPWRKIISEAAAVKLHDKKKQSKPSDAWEYVAQWARWGQDELEDVSASPFKVEKLLSVQGHACSMLGCGHPHSWHEYISQFISLYSETPSEGYRMPNVKEAEEADGLAMGEFFKLLLKGRKADDALHTVVKERDVLRRLLFCPPKAAKESKGAGKGKEREPLPRKTGKRQWSGQEAAVGDKRPKAMYLCNGHQTGKCKLGPACKFIHRCANCFEEGHGVQKAVTIFLVDIPGTFGAANML